jgi:spore maturation protein CgeB
MRFVIFGLTVSSSWGNGHATLWRGLIRALAARGHHVTFYERDVSYYAGCHRDLPQGDVFDLRLYSDWSDVARRDVELADVAMVTSYCPDATAATNLILEACRGARVFYDLDTPITLANRDAGQSVAYIPPQGLGDFDLVLSYTGGIALERLQSDFGARRVAPLYGSVDPRAHYPVAPDDTYRADLSYLGTYAADRQEGVERLLLETARRLPSRRFVIGGAQYPVEFPWSDNIFFVRHIPPPDHPAFYCSSPLTLNVTREAMAAMGHCPSGRLFEAAACGVAIVSDVWEGLETFFTPGEEILLAVTTNDVIDALQMDDAQLQRIGRAARERALADHTAARRAEELVRFIEGSSKGSTSCGESFQRPASAVEFSL